MKRRRITGVIILGRAFSTIVGVENLQPTTVTLAYRSPQKLYIDIIIIIIIYSFIKNSTISLDEMHTRTGQKGIKCSNNCPNG